MSDVQGIINAISYKRSDIRALETRQTDLENELHHADSDLGRAASTISKLKQELAQQEEKREKINKDRRELQRQYNQTSASLRDSRAEMGILEEDLHYANRSPTSAGAGGDPVSPLHDNSNDGNQVVSAVPGALGLPMMTQQGQNPASKGRTGGL